MSRYRGPRLRITRRLGFLPGLTKKEPNDKKLKPPGQHGKENFDKLRSHPAFHGLNPANPVNTKQFRSADRKKKKNSRSKVSQYTLGLFEKQKLRFNYGLSERQLFNYVKKARRSSGASGEVLLQLLEMRLDNIVFRLGMAPTIVAARQLVTHGHVLVNDQRLSFPSYQCQLNDQINFKSDPVKETSLPRRRRLVKARSGKATPKHLSFDSRTSAGLVKGLVNRTSIPLVINELLVIEFYSRKI
jgi:small subunit ribosomal protein S4